VRPLALVCSRCDPHLPFWQEALLGLLALAIAFGLLAGLLRLGMGRSSLRDLRLRTCFLAVQRGWQKDDPAQFAPFVTPELASQLRAQLAEIAASGRVIHHERPRIRRLRVVDGGGRGDRECVVRIQSSVRHWVADAGSGELVAGSRDVSHDDAAWRFVRDPPGDWLAAEIGVATGGSS
jgi:predicted lipid-binding transport protein (Tim44 family)